MKTSAAPARSNVIPFPDRRVRPLPDPMLALFGVWQFWFALGFAVLLAINPQRD
jgi:hypothetical protein